jgi:hypothetical protein
VIEVGHLEASSAKERCLHGTFGVVNMLYIRCLRQSQRRRDSCCPPKQSAELRGRVLMEAELLPPPPPYPKVPDPDEYARLARGNNLSNR